MAELLRNLAYRGPRGNAADCDEGPEVTCRLALCALAALLPAWGSGSVGQADGGTAGATQATAYRFVRRPVVVFIERRSRAMFKAYVHLNRSLPRGRERIELGGAAPPEGPFVSSRRHHCYIQEAADFEVEPSLRHPHDGIPIAVEVGRFRPNRTFANARVHAHRVSFSSYENFRHEQARLRRLGCGRHART